MHSRGHHVPTVAKISKFLLTDTTGNTTFGYTLANKAGMGLWQVNELCMAIHAKELAAIVDLAAHVEEFTNHLVVIWSDSQAVVHVLNLFKPHTTIIGHLRAMVGLQHQYNIFLSTAFITTKLNTTVGWLS